MIELRPQHVPIARAAELLGVSRRTLERMWADGELATHTLRGRRFVPLSEIARLSGAAPVGAPVGEPRRRRKRKLAAIRRD